VSAGDLDQLTRFWKAGGVRFLRDRLRHGPCLVGTCLAVKSRHITLTSGEAPV
jgi:hypothetical protein